MIEVLVTSTFLSSFQERGRQTWCYFYSSKTSRTEISSYLLSADWVSPQLVLPLTLAQEFLYFCIILKTAPFWNSCGGTEKQIKAIKTFIELPYLLYCIPHAQTEHQNSLGLELLFHWSSHNMVWFTADELHRGLQNECTAGIDTA